ncbi:unnamed protein product [Effrenium voratum]|nr:unnamed protein product [Effrenium voratum]
MVLPWVEDETVDSSDEEALDNSEARVGGYGGAKKAYLIEEVERRAITIKQLRTLHSFLQYLTKTEVLKHTSEFSRTTGMHNKLIPWTSLNMYDITTEVIKKVIPHVDPEGEHIDDERRWYSWVEFVAAKEQPAQIMLSHWWGGRFMDFMQSVDKMALDRSLSIYTPIWICTFANCQFGENFGSKLMDCPFICTLKTVNLTVLIVDFQGGSLTRTWCGLEVHYTTHNEIDFALYTSAGRVGSTYVSGGPLVEAVKNWDIRTSEASDPPYRRQILNYVAKVSELEGLEKDEEGQLVLDNMGRPQLSSDALDPHGAMRSSGEKEFAHEANLFRKHAKRFEHLNMMVRLRVMATLGLPKKPKGCTVAEVALRGVTLNQLRVMSAKLESSCPWSEDDEEECPWGDDLNLDEGQSLCYEELTIEHVAAWIKFQTAMVWEGEGPGSYMEIISDGPQKPQFAVTFSQSQLWHERMSAIEVFAEAQQLPDSAIFFVELLGVRMWLRWEIRELKREDQLRRISKKAFQDQQARRSASESALQRAGRKTLQEQLQHPNTWRYDKPQRQLKHQVLQGDGRAKMLSRVFLNGDRNGDGVGVVGERMDLLRLKAPAFAASVDESPVSSYISSTSPNYLNHARKPASYALHLASYEGGNVMQLQYDSLGTAIDTNQGVFNDDFVMNTSNSGYITREVFCVAELLQNIFQALTGELQAVREELESWVSYGPRACQLLQQLKSFQVSVEILRSTQLGKILGRYTRHPEACVAASAKKLVEGWKEQLRPRTQVASDDDSDAPRRKRDRRTECEERESVEVTSIKDAPPGWTRKQAFQQYRGKRERFWLFTLQRPFGNAAWLLQVRAKAKAPPAKPKPNTAAQPADPEEILELLDRMARDLGALASERLEAEDLRTAQRLERLEQRFSGSGVTEEWSAADLVVESSVRWVQPGKRRQAWFADACERCATPLGVEFGYTSNGGCCFVGPLSSLGLWFRVGRGDTPRDPRGQTPVFLGLPGRGVDHGAGVPPGAVGPGHGDEEEED